MRSRVSPARHAAYRALRTIDDRDAFAQDVIAKDIDRSDIPRSDKAFATRLVLGVVSTKGSLDIILDRCLKSPKDVKRDVRCALRISIYEIIFLDKQAHAAVDQGVELVGSIAPRAKGLANHVLRKVISMRSAFPFGDPDSSIDALALKEGFPAWLVAYLISVYGKDEARSFMRASNEPAVVYVVINPLKHGASDLVHEAAEHGVAMQPVFVYGIEVPGCFELADRRSAADPFILKAIEQGRICISDASAQMVAHIVSSAAVASFRDSHPLASDEGIANEMSFLELCAGRATKTVLLQSDLYRMLGAQIKDFIALDNIPFKIGILEERADRYGIHVGDAICADATDLLSVFSDKRFDCVFLDSPCTGLGTLRRHPEIRWRISPESIEGASALDSRLLASAAAVVREGGVLAYATCTITPEENEQAILSFLKSDIGSDFRIVSIDGIIGDRGHESDDAKRGLFFQPPLASHGPDSHFCCVLRRVS